DLAAGVADRHTMTADEKTQLTVLTGQITTPLGTAQSDLQQAIDFNAAVKTPVEAGSKKFQETTNQFLDMLKKELLTSDKVHLTPSQVAQTGNAVLAAGLAYHQVEIKELDNLLTIRINGYVTRRNFVDILAVVSLVMATYLFLCFYGSVVSSVT